MYKTSKIVVHIDGSSQGNPGLSGISAVFETSDRKKLLETSKFIGEATNNRAEYQALILALNILKVKERDWSITNNTEIVIKTDSELLFNQINGSYKVKDWILRKLYTQVLNLKKEIPQFKLELIPREENRTCDKLAKRAIKDAIKKLHIKPKTNKEVRLPIRPLFL